MATSGVNVEDLDNGLRVVRRKYRNHRYVLTELPYVDYQKTVKQATSHDDAANEDRYDADTHNAILLSKCVRVDGKKVASDALYEEGTALVRQLIRDLSTLHFDEEKIELDDDSDDGTGEAPPASSSAKAS